MGSKRAAASASPCLLGVGSSIRTGIYGSSIRTFSSFWGQKSRGKDCPMGSLLFRSLLVNGGRNASLSLVGGDGLDPGELMCH